MPTSNHVVNRRFFPHATGIALALPLLESPSTRVLGSGIAVGTKAGSPIGGARPIRLVCVGNMLGFYHPEFHPEKTGRAYDLPRLLQPLAPHRDDEYFDSVRAVEKPMFDPTTNFPRDQMVMNMDNIGDVLKTSGFLLAHDLEAADQVVEKAFNQSEQPREQIWRSANPHGPTPATITRDHCNTFRLTIHKLRPTCLS